MEQNDLISISIHRDDPSSFYAKIPYDMLPRVHRIGGKWMQSGREWKFPLDDSIWEKFQEEFKDFFTAGRVKKDVAFILAFDKRKKDLDRFMKFKDVAMKDAPTDFGVEGVGLNGQNCLFNYQRWGVKCGLYVGDGFLIGDEMGLGKAIPVNELVYIPHGVTEIGKLRIGDYVIGRDGNKTRVVGVYPQGIRKTYRMTFSDGCSVECDENHLWSVRSNNCIDKDEQYQTLSTSQLVDKNGFMVKHGFGNGSVNECRVETYYKCSNGNSRWHIPMCDPVHFENDGALPIEPYLFGLVLGGGIMCGKNVKIELNNDDFDELFYGHLHNDISNEHEVNACSDSTKEISFSLENELSSLGIINSGACDKFIPDCYKYSSIENRLSLLHGLMDIGGHCVNHGDSRTDDNNFYGAEYCAVSKRLALDVMELVHTLGGIASLRLNSGIYSNYDEAQVRNEAYNISVKIPERFNPFTLRRKAESYIFPQKHNLVRHIKDIEYIGEKETVCIKVDAPDELYLIRHCVVTHNTIQGIGIAVEHMNRGDIRNCLVVCPASLKYNWLDEIKKFTGINALVIGHKCKNSEDREKQWIAAGYQFKIVNYETVARDLYADPKKTDNRISCYKAVLNSFDAIVFDEIHMLKHHSSQRTMACRQFNAKYRIGLTGTPLDGRLEEIHSIFQILKPGLFVSKQKFMERYAEYDYFGAVKGYHHIREVSDKIAPYYLRRIKTEVLKDLPPKLHKDMLVELSPKNMKVYKDIVKKKNEITEESTAMEVIMRARQFLDFPEILGLKNTSDKFAVFKELLDELVKENNHKVIIFSQYTNTLHWIMKNIRDEYDDIMVIDGSVDPEERQEICKKFNSDPKYKILMGTNAMSTGLNIQAADDVINYTDDFSPAIMKQREDRAYRCGVTHTITVYNFVCMDTVDEHVRNILKRKQAVNDALLKEKGGDSFAVGNLSTMEILSCL